MLAIKNNIMAANAARYLGRSYDALATSVERPWSGFRETKHQKRPAPHSHSRHI